MSLPFQRKVPESPLGRVTVPDGRSPDEQAAHLMETLAVLGKHAPEDVAVVGFDDIALARSTTPPLTTISQPVKKLASTAFKSLLARIRYPNNDPREILLDAPLVLRQST